MRLVLSCIVLAALAGNPCLAKDGHPHGPAQHSAGAAANGVSGKGASGANPIDTNANVSIDGNGAVAPPVLPPRGVTQRQIRTVNPSGKTATNPVSRATMGTTTIPAAHNAIGQPVVPPQNLAGVQPLVPALQKPGAVPIVHGGPVATPGSSGAAHVNIANATNRASANGAAVIRPAAAPTVIGGPAAAHYGINGTTVQNKR